jgi:hypothetical protein
MEQALAHRKGRAGVTDIPIHEMSPEQATAALASLQREWDAHNAAAAPPDKPTTAIEARAKLDTLTANKSWADKLEKGDVEVQKEFKTLTALAADLQPGDQLDRVAGTAERPMIETITDGQLSTGKLMSAVDGLREVGINDEAIKEAINGGRNSAVIHRATQELKAKLFGDQAWVKRYLEGGQAERRQATLISIILSGEVAE